VSEPTEVARTAPQWPTAAHLIARFGRDLNNSHELQPERPDDHAGKHRRPSMGTRRALCPRRPRPSRRRWRNLALDQLGEATPSGCRRTPCGHASAACRVGVEMPRFWPNCRKSASCVRSARPAGTVGWVDVEADGGTMAVEDPTKGFDMTVASSDEAVRRVALEDLQPGAAICGVLPHALVTAVSAAWYGAHRARRSPAAPCGHARD